MDFFADRLDDDAYSDDPLVSVFESDASEVDSLWIPERLFGRLVLIAQAYHLHTLPLCRRRLKTDPLSTVEN